MKTLLFSVALSIIMPSLAKDLTFATLEKNEVNASIDRAKAEQNLIFCAFNSYQETFYSLSCVDAIKSAILFGIKQRFIVSKLMLNKNIHHEDETVPMREKIDAVLYELDPEQDPEKQAQQIAQVILSME